MAIYTPEIYILFADTYNPKANLAYKDPKTTITNIIIVLSFNY